MNKNRVLVKPVTTLLALAVLSSFGALVSTRANADEGGTSFWLPGQYGSMAAVPAVPGWSLPLVYYHSSVDADGSKTFSKGGKITAGLDVDIDLLFAVPTYVFTNPFLGAQASISMAAVYGHVAVDVDAILTGPGGQALSGRDSDSSTALGDLYPSATLRWNNGNHNTMAYTMLGVPVGSYDKDELANIGTNHWAVDMGGAAVARLHADPVFQLEVKAAKAELADLRTKDFHPTRDCQAEAEALGHHLQPLND